MNRPTAAHLRRQRRCLDMSHPATTPATPRSPALSLVSSDVTAKPTHREMANAIRFLAVDAVEKAKSGHPGMPMGMADVATVLFSRFMKFDAADAAWPDRDRFV